VKLHPGIDATDLLKRLEELHFTGRLTDADPTLWGPDAEEEAGRRLGWLTLPVASQEQLPRLHQLRAAALADGLHRVVLAGMGGSSLAPEVICAGAGVELLTLDSTDPAQVHRALDPQHHGRTLLVVSSKSGSTLETDSHLRIGLSFLRPDQVVVVTDPGSPLEAHARELHVRDVVLANPDVGGRYSALSAFGLVPSALAGADVELLLRDAATVDIEVGVRLGAAIATEALTGRNHLLLPPSPQHPGLADWVEQLVAESTGKQGRGVVPVVVGKDQWWPSGPTLQAVAHQPVQGVATHVVSGSLGELFQAWEVATTVVGWALGINPFDQPDVEAAKVAARGLLEGAVAPVPLATPQDDIQARLRAAILAVPDDGYLGVHAYLDRTGESDVAELRGLLQQASAAPVTFGWGPRFLHSTGQLHKGGPDQAAFLQITAEAPEDLTVPGRPWGMATFQQAQAAGDAEVLRARGRTVVQVHLPARGRREALDLLLDAARGLSL
jgi:glucose-6-phosphate isomerase